MSSTAGGVADASMGHTPDQGAVRLVRAHQAA